MERPERGENHEPRRDRPARSNSRHHARERDDSRWVAAHRLDTGMGKGGWRVGGQQHHARRRAGHLRRGAGRCDSQGWAVTSSINPSGAKVLGVIQRARHAGADGDDDVAWRGYGGASRPIWLWRWPQLAKHPEAEDRLRPIRWERPRRWGLEGSHAV